MVQGKITSASCLLLSYAGSFLGAEYIPECTSITRMIASPPHAPDVTVMFISGCYLQ